MHYLQVLGRLKRGVNLDSAKAGMGVVAENIARISPETNKDWGVTIEPLRDALSDRDLRVASLVLASVVGFIFADGVCERRQPDACKRSGASPRDRCTRIARRQPS